MPISIETDGPTAVHDVTDRVEAAITTDADGLVTVFVRHTTAGVVVNEPESRLLGDVETFLEELVPDEGWEHDRLDDNADAHLRAMLLGESVTVPVSDGTLDLGRWQAVLLVECDGPRTRSIDVIPHGTGRDR
ncbi:secondary thiamine-phosphate synthase enzyme YjbQ [Halopenitus persicus]|uniref:Secondary thiamine-phosphate synthase enzyme n=1 Tax=Halopenitus persicus TaxID=1048396 RepID=A0A1H3G282_9EURY|nr:secondary thiamine-phosphate synthase enzyme YjbQ [Halopenitus persicus]QHS16877.1 YjbQ family protein [haloarchaeon 3A1-DGR]SDX97442.1 secondary thiamine-phosphate synthase enzyme [Halopenitus persicus]